MKTDQEINDRIAFLNNTTLIQNKSISELYKQATDLVESNSRISREIESLYKAMRKPK